MKLPAAALQQTLESFVEHARPRSKRSMSQWVEEEIILPTGPFRGEEYRHSRHPVSAVWFDAIDSGRWNRFAASGPTQNGKSLMCYVSPVLYHLFELNETVVVGLPSMQMANDKWLMDFLPVIESSNFADLLPDKGEGSRGGQVKRGITFQHGASLRFMSAGGSDKKRAGYTTRVLAVTETDGMDESSETSREADKITQLEGRTRAFQTSKRVYLECTVSIERGRIWQEIKNGTDSRLVRPCPHCGQWVSPDREHLRGWQQAESEGDARTMAYWVCPACEHPWSEEDRWQAAEAIQLVHRGQEITPDGEIVGGEPNTNTLGLRWSAIDNPFTNAGELGADEWKARRNRDQESAEKEMRQFVWCIPYDPPEIELTPLLPEQVESRTRKHKKGIVPTECLAVNVGVDTGKRMLHWTAGGLLPAGGMPIVDYGKQTVEADRLGVYRALIESLWKLFEYFENGWQGEGSAKFIPAQVWIDSAYYEHTDAVYAFCAEANAKLGLKPGQERYRPTKGYGQGQRGIGPYVPPAGKQHDVLYIGKQMHIARVRRGHKIVPGVLLVHMNADHWKSELHQRFVQEADQPGAVTLFELADHFGHSEFAQHLTAEKQIEKFMPHSGATVIWENVRRANHFFDSTYAALAACQFVWELLNRPAKKERKSLAAFRK